MSKLAAITLFILGALLLIATEFFRVYLIMPFPGSQQADTVGLAWSIDHYRIALRILGLLLIAAPLVRFWRTGRTGRKIMLSVLIIFYAVIFYFFNFRFEADKMFYQPKSKIFANAANNKIALDKLVIGVVIGNEAKAYPIQLIGYHHQVRDTIGATPVMITYCTVCRTGRAYSPNVDGKLEDFRLVGMDHFNAMFEDATTKSWWQQATGISVAGPLKDHHLAELPSQQLSLAQWLEEHPGSTILQPDTFFKRHYDSLDSYDDGTIAGSLEHRDTASWKFKSWVVGVRAGGQTRAYDWNDLTTKGLIEDTIGATPMLLVTNNATTDFHAYSRQLDGQTLSFSKAAGLASAQSIGSGGGWLQDSTGSKWNFEGRCIDGPLKDRRLQPLQSYQEFWHSWSHFHPETTRGL